MSSTEQTELFSSHRLTRVECHIYLNAYAANQPQPNSRLSGERYVSAVYWACCAVQHFRGCKETPSDHLIRDMFAWVQQHAEGVMFEPKDPSEKRLQGYFGPG